MASAQVSKKQEHLQAGRKKLEEFRRKQAEKKKAAAANQTAAAVAVTEQPQSLEEDQVQLEEDQVHGTNSISHVPAENHLDSSGVVANYVNKESNVHTSGSDNAKSAVSGNSNFLTSPALEYYAPVGLDGSKNVDDKYQHKIDVNGLSSQFPSGSGTDNYFTSQISSVKETDHATSNSNNPVFSNHIPNNYGQKDNSFGNSVTSSVFGTYSMHKSSSSPLQDKLSSIGQEDNGVAYLTYQESSVFSRSSATDSDSRAGQQFSVFSDMGNKNSSSIAHTGRANPLSPWISDHGRADYNFQTSLNNGPPSPPISGRKSRPSFLDSIQIDKGPSPPISEEETTNPFSSKVYPMDGQGPLASHVDGIGLFNHVGENKHDFFSQKQNEDFAALEQHIEELTQDKFSLQRALEASRALAENLASENSALTDSYNQQGGAVNQLKLDLEMLQEEIKAQMVELEAVRTEYANAQLECNAADQRAKLLASELIEMEEKSLRVRSNELKLERQLESSQAEISSYRKKLSSLEKDRQDLQSTIDALKEEKKLLQSKLRKASSGGKSVDTNKNANTKKEVSTSTEDLEIDTTQERTNLETVGSSSLVDVPSSSSLAHDNVQLSLESLDYSIPSDHLRMVQNINTLIAELSLEKDQLMQALSAESTQCSNLLGLNKELTRKLEAQTQRLELLTAQSMANDNFQPRQSLPSTLHETATYADEGDEVVERVLGWIMKLFPGGPSRRRTSKHL